MGVLPREYNSITPLSPFFVGTSAADTQFRFSTDRQYFRRIQSALFIGCLRLAHRISLQNNKDSIRENASLATTGQWYCAQPRSIGLSRRIKSSCFTARLSLITFL